jgi:hypothetical protein
MNAGDMLLFQSDLQHKGKATTTSEDTVGIILNYALPNSKFNANNTFLENEKF